MQANSQVAAVSVATDVEHAARRPVQPVAPLNPPGRQKRPRTDDNEGCFCWCIFVFLANQQLFD